MQETETGLAAFLRDMGTCPFEGRFLVFAPGGAENSDGGGGAKTPWG